MTTTKVILTAWLVAGTLDLADAILWARLHRRPADRMLQFIASGAVGKLAFRGGAAAAALGVLVHYAIMLVMVVVFVVAAGRLPILARLPLISGPIYGIGLYLVMYRIVLPWRFPGPPAPFDLAGIANQVFAHTCLVGLPIALIAARA
jgi:uncharacterized membrane protein YagU involved in acid resistance